MLQVRSRAQEAIARVRAGAFSAMLAASLVAAAGAMAGCGPVRGDEAQAAQVAVADATAGLATESGAAENLLSLIAFYPQDYGVSADVFAAWYFDGVDCEASQADVQGDAATVNVTFSTKRMADVLPIMEHARDAALVAGADASRDGYANEQFEAATANAQVATDQLSVPVTLTRASDGTWVIADEATLAAALLDGYDPRQISVD